MSALPKSRIRIAGDLFRFSRLSDILRPFEINQFEEQVPLPPRLRAADALQIEVAFFNDGTLLNDLSSIASLQLAIKPLAAAAQTGGEQTGSNPDELRGPASNVAPILFKTIAAANFTTGLTQNQWDSKAADKAHAIISLDSEETAIAPGERWLALVAEGHDGQSRTIAAGPVLILGGGATYNALPQPIVKDLRDQAAQSAAQAAQSKTAAAISEQAATAAAHSAQQTLADTQAVHQSTAATTAAAAAAATAASQSATAAQSAVTSAEQSAAEALQHAQAARQVADDLGDINAALSQASQYADQSADSAQQAAASAALSQSAATALNPYAMASAPRVLFSGGAAATIANSPDAFSLIGDTLTFEALINHSASAGKSFEIFRTCAQHSSANGGWALSVLPSGHLQLVMYRAGSAGQISHQFQSAQVIPARQQSHIVVIAGVSEDGITADTKHYINGKLTAWNQTIATGQPTGPATFASASIGSTADSSQTAAGEIANLHIYNRELSSSEIAELASSGGQIIPAQARIIDLQPSTITTFPDPLTAEVILLRTTAEVIQGDVLGIHKPLKVTTNTLGGNHAIQFNSMAPLCSGELIEFSFNYYIPSANAALIGLRVLFGGNGFTTKSGSTNATTTGQWATARFTAVVPEISNNTRPRLYSLAPDIAYEGNGSDHFYLANIRLRQLGCVLNLPMSEGSGYQCRNRSSREQHALLPVSGAVHGIEKNTFEFSWTRISSGFLGDADRPVLPKGFIIDEVLWEDSKATRTTASLGFSDVNPAGHVAVWTPARNRQRAALANLSTEITDQRLYLAMTANPGAVTIRLRGHIPA